MELFIFKMDLSSFELTADETDIIIDEISDEIGEFKYVEAELPGSLNLAFYGVPDWLESGFENLIKSKIFEALGSIYFLRTEKISERFAKEKREGARRFYIENNSLEIREKAKTERLVRDMESALNRFKSVD